MMKWMHWPVPRSMPLGHARRFVAWSCVIVTLFVGGAHAQVPVPAPAAAAPTDAVVLVTPGTPPVPLLWKVSDADNAVYLLGSFHLLKPDDYPLSNDVNEAFARARSVVFELPPEEMASPQLGLKMAQAALRKDGTSLDSELPKATATKLAAWTQANADRLRQIGFQPDALQLYEPWFAGLMISMLDMTTQGLDPSLGLDQHFAAAALAASKPTSGFETGLEQIAFLEGMGKDEQLQFLDEALTDATSGDEIDRLHAAWRAGDDAALIDDMGADMQRRYPKLYRRINVDRNDAWLPKIQRLLANPGSDDTLVVVGALHLLGSDGIVEKLRAKGYSVERLCSSCVAPSQNAIPLPAALPPASDVAPPSGR